MFALIVAGPGLYLRPDVHAEPLVGRWSAWVNLIPPATAAFVIVERQLRAMESFARSPALHAASVRSPLLRSGPFIDLPAERAPAIAALVAEVQTRCAPQIAFVKAVRALGGLLRERATGGSLEALHAEVPDALRGLVELYYDRHHRPDFRFYEALLYDSPLYDAGLQRLVLRPGGDDRGRPFVFSTPRLRAPEAVELALPFASPALDLLFSTRVAPTALSALHGALGPALDPDQYRRFASLFTPEPPPPRPAYAGDAARVRYFGHACLLIETRQTSILIDPLVSYGQASGPERFTYADLPARIDTVLITHAHHDHVVLETLLQLRHRIGRVVVPRNVAGALQDPSLTLLLRALGFRDVIALDAMDTLPLGCDEELTALPFVGEHHDLLVGSKLTYHLRFGRSTVMVAADSCNLAPDLYRHIQARIGPIDTLFLGMECEGAPLSWVYGSLLDQQTTRENDQERRGRGSNAAEGLDLVRCFDPSRAFIYAMGAEPWLNHILDLDYHEGDLAIRESDAFIAACRDQGRVAERLFLKREIQL
ncbi:MAG: MBL fold metallo-hydrolase [Pseudomonadota bacterium]